MAKVIIGNNRMKVNELKNHFNQYGFNDFTEYNRDNILALFYKKLNTIDYCNYYEENNDFICTVGTIIYRQATGISALKQILRDFSTYNIENIRNVSIGNYAVIIKKGLDIYIFVDKNSIYNLYYYNDNNEWLVSNTYYHLGKVRSTNKFNYLDILEYSFNNAIIGNKTPIEGIYKLLGNEYFHIDLNLNKMQTKKLDCNNSLCKTSSFDLFLSDLKNIIHVISKNYSNITISSTGGLDSRLFTALFLSNNVKPQLVYGIGNSKLTNTKVRDLEINKMYSECYDLKLSLMNWETKVPFNIDWDYSLEKFGELFIADAGNKNIYDSFECIEFDYITFGYFGELMRNIEWIDMISSEYFTLQQFVEMYINKNIPVNEDTKRNIYDYIYSKFAAICQAEEIDINMIHKDKFSLIHYHYRRNADTVMCNLMNIYGHSSIVLSEDSLLQYILNVPYNKKMNSKLILKVIKCLYPEILKIPIYSHTKEWIYNPKKGTIQRKDISGKVPPNIKRIILESQYKKYFIKINKMLSKKHNGNFKEENLNNLKQLVVNELSKYHHQLYDIDGFEGDIRHLVRYLGIEYMIEKLTRRR
ncbi:hypothetical protein DES36_12521 [Alkalibaculum bacchi]|uniref:Asparagine synthase n=1 Tax=Alkalibaculum bacchi TaxID=645887 RepID=A0A366HX44_9FIRM|nr:hypothetical protein [Alkalibaculum bacchi]RBP58086.1 hypothetical protein DES36_12521 [Alkalibaculum bacchi]